MSSSWIAARAGRNGFDPAVIGTMDAAIAVSSRPRGAPDTHEENADAAAKVEADIAEAIKRHGIRAKWTARSLALHTQAVLQGAFILAKAKGNAAVAADSIDHLRRYIELLFQPAKLKGKATS